MTMTTSDQVVADIATLTPTIDQHENLRRLHALLHHVGDEQVHMASWYSDRYGIGNEHDLVDPSFMVTEDSLDLAIVSDCGTAACAAGWTVAALMSDEQRSALRRLTVNVGGFGVIDRALVAQQYVGLFLGISELIDEAGADGTIPLFHVCDWPVVPTGSEREALIYLVGEILNGRPVRWRSTRED